MHTLIHKYEYVCVYTYVYVYMYTALVPTQDSEIIAESTEDRKIIRTRGDGCLQGNCIANHDGQD